MIGFQCLFSFTYDFSCLATFHLCLFVILSKCFVCISEVLTKIFYTFIHHSLWIYCLFLQAVSCYLSRILSGVWVWSVSAATTATSSVRKPWPGSSAAWHGTSVARPVPKSSTTGISRSAHCWYFKTNVFAHRIIDNPLKLSLCGH